MSVVQLGLLLLVSAALCLGVASLPLQQDDGSENAESKMKMHIIVMKRTGVNHTTQSSMRCSEFLEMVSSGKYDGIDSARRKPSVGHYRSVGIGYTAELDDMAVKMLTDMDDVDFVEQDQEMEAAAFLYPIKLGYHTDRIDQRELPLDGQYNPPYTGKGVDIYIMDTGISYSHTLYGGRAQFGGYDRYGNDGKDCNGHGTHVAGLAGADIIGAAPEANIYSIKVLDCQQSGTYAGLIAGMNHVIDRAQNNPSRRSIISMSLIGPPSRSVNVALQRAHEAGVITVSAAGNFKKDSCGYSPASSEYTITVGGSRQKGDGLYWFANSGTNFGKCVDIFAPGQWVRSASHESDNHLVSKSGTSMSTPIVSGVVAMMLEEDPSLSSDEVKARLQARATKDALDFSVLTSEVQSETPNLLVYTGQKVLDSTSTPTTQAKTTPTTRGTTSATKQATTTPTMPHTAPPTTRGTAPPTTKTTPPSTTKATAPPTTKATTPPITKTTDPPTTKTTPPSTTKATAPPTTKSTATPTATQQTRESPPTSPPSLVHLPTLQPRQDSELVVHESRISVNLSVEAAFMDAFVKWGLGFLATSVNAYTTSGVTYLAIVYKYVGLVRIQNYLFERLPIADVEGFLSKVDKWSIVAMAPYENANGKIYVFCVLKLDGGDRQLVMEKTVEDFLMEDEEKRKQGYGPITVRFRNSVQDGSRVYAIYAKDVQAIVALDLSLPALRSRAYREWVNGRLISDLSYQHKGEITTYSAIFSKPELDVLSFHTDVRHSADQLTFISNLLRKSSFHAVAMTPILENSGSSTSVGFYTAYWRIPK